MTTLKAIAWGFSDLAFTVLAVLLLTRALLFSVNADPFHPLVKFLIDFTRPILALPHKILPPLLRVDPACWLSAFLMCLAELYVRIFINDGDYPIAAVFIVALLDMTELTFYILITATLVVSVGSWFMSPHQVMANPIMSLFHLMIAPALNLIRRVVPTFGVVDLSPMVFLFLVYFALIVLRALF